MTTRYSAKSRADIERLAADIENLPVRRKIVVGARCFADGLMVMPLWVRICLSFAVWRHGKLAAYYLWFLRMEQADPGNADDMWQQIVQHMLNGKDREDRGSVGGFSQRELDMFVGYLEAAQ